MGLQALASVVVIVGTAIDLLRATTLPGVQEVCLLTGSTVQTTLILIGIFLYMSGRPVSGLRSTRMDCSSRQCLLLSCNSTPCQSPRSSISLLWPYSCRSLVQCSPRSSRLTGDELRSSPNCASDAVKI